MWAFLLWVWAAPLLAQPDVAGILARVSEEAEVFRQMAPRALAEETLEQRAVRPASRFRPRVGAAARQASRPVFVTREIVSEYSVGKLQDAAPGKENDLYEFRQVVSVDGRKIQSEEKARHTLSLNMQGATDRARKRMLEDFERHGLPGASVSDFGTVLLLFCKRMAPAVELTPRGETRIGADEAFLLEYRQTGPAAAVLDFHGKEIRRQPLRGELAVRKSDGLPLRITVTDRRAQDGHDWVDEAVVDYAVTPHGFLAPVSVAHRRAIDSQVVLENRFRYAPFKMFGADVEIKFTEVPEPSAR